MASKRPPSLVVPPLLLSRLSSLESLGAEGGSASGSASARELTGGVDPLVLPTARAQTARPLGVTPRGRAMLGPRADALAGWTRGGAQNEGVPRASPRGTSMSSPRRGTLERDAHPRAARSEWLLAASVLAAERCNLSPTSSWLANTRGACVRVLRANGSSTCGRLGPSRSANRWTVHTDTPESCHPESAGGGHVADGVLVVSAAMLSRATPARGDLARAVLGASTGFRGVVLSVDGDVAVVRADDRRVRALPLEVLTRE